MKKHRKRTQATAALVTLALVVLGVRIALPYYLEYRADQAIAANPDYHGDLDDVDLQLWRGAIQLEGLDLEAARPQASVSKLHVPRIDIHLHWKALLDGAFVGEVDVERPEVTLTPSRAEVAAEKQAEGGEEPLAKQLSSVMPFQVDRFQVHDGAVALIDPVAKDEQLQLDADQLYLTVTNLTNRVGKDEESFATADLKARFEKVAPFEGHVKFDPLAGRPTFDVNATLGTFELKRLNHVLRSYLGIDVQGGTAKVYVEAAAKDGHFEGYVKPLLQDPQIFSLAEDHHGVVGFLKEALAAGAAELLENQPKDRLASKIPFEGDLSDPQAGLWPAVGSVLYNGFVEALKPRLDQSIDLEKVAEDAGD